MKKGIIFISFCIILFLSACSPKTKIMNLHKIKNMEKYQAYNPFRVEDGMLYFTIFEEEGMNVYAIDLITSSVKKLFCGIHQYSSFIHLKDEEAVYVDQNGNLFHKKGEEITKIDDNISGLDNPNILISPKGDGILYTKGSHENSSVYLYIMGKEKPQLIRDSISEEAYKTFPFTTQWSNRRNYFVFNNNQVYNDRGEKIATIEATSVKWSPNDVYVAYIQKPENLQENKINIGNWSTYIGNSFVLLHIDDGEQRVILKSEYGLINPIDTIQWSWNSENVAILVGKVKKSHQDVLEEFDYQGVEVYNIPRQNISKVERLRFNFYQLLFTDYIYGKELGKKGSLQVYPVNMAKGRIYDNPLILNNQDLFIISGKEKAYLIDGNELIELDSTGKEKHLVKFPWKPYFMFLDEKNRSLIIINVAREIYRYPLK